MQPGADAEMVVKQAESRLEGESTPFLEKKGVKRSLENCAA